VSALLLAVLLAAGAPQDEDEEPTDYFKWARQLEALDLAWQWGDFSFAFSGEADLEVFVFGKEAPGVHIQDPALRSDRYKRGRLADSPEAVGRLSAFLDGTYTDLLDWSIEGRLDGTTAVGDVVGARFEQFWVRLKVPETPEANVQFGKFAAPIGNFIPRSMPRKNPLTTWPMPYDHLTSLTSLGDSAARLSTTKDAPDIADWYVPIWQAVYTPGLMGFGTHGDLSYAAAIMDSAPATLPFEWDRKVGHPKFFNYYLHATYILDITTKVGATASWGPYEKRDFAGGGPPGPGPGPGGGGVATGDPEDFRQTLVGIDAEFMTGHLEMYGEFFWTRLETELAGRLDLWTWYVEAKYTFTASVFGAVRLAQMFFGQAVDVSGEKHQWDRDVTRVEVGGGYFFAANFFAKATVQLNLHMGGREPSDTMLMLQLGLGF
jgi:hypothetical protein